MGRSINRAPVSTSTDGSARGGPGGEREAGGGFASATIDTYSDRLMKLIPAEVVAFYLAMDTAVHAHNDDKPLVLLLIWLLGCVATWFHLKVVAKVDYAPQIAVSVGAFAVWALNIGQGRVFEWLQPSYAVLLLLAYTFFAPELPFLKREK